MRTARLTNPFVQAPLNVTGNAKVSTMQAPAVKEHELALDGHVYFIPVSNLTAGDPVIDKIQRFRQLTTEITKEPYDRVIRSTGWKHNVSIYHPSALPALQVRPPRSKEILSEQPLLCPRVR